MKKLIFGMFLATFAVTGAFAQTYYGPTGTVYNCPTGPSTCNLLYGTNPNVSATFPQTAPIRSLSSIPSVLPE